MRVVVLTFTSEKTNEFHPRLDRTSVIDSVQRRNSILTVVGPHSVHPLEHPFDVSRMKMDIVSRSYVRTVMGIWVSAPSTQPSATLRRRSPLGLGHVFEGEGLRDGNGKVVQERHCVNSASLKFQKKT